MICDFAEYYHILDYEKLPPSKAAVLFWGLPPNSRVMRYFNKSPASNEVMLLATIADGINFIAWSKTKDAEKGRNRPDSILDTLRGKTNNTDLTTFDTGADYEEARRKLLERINNNG